MGDHSTKELEVLMVEHGKEARTVKIDGSLKGLQKAVGGDIEAAYFFSDPVALACQEAGKLNGAPLNRAIYGEDGTALDIIAGNFIVCGLTEESFASLPVALRQKYLDEFKKPQALVRAGNLISVVQIEKDKPHKREREEL